MKWWTSWGVSSYRCLLVWRGSEQLWRYPSGFLVVLLGCLGWTWRRTVVLSCGFLVVQGIHCKYGCFRTCLSLLLIQTNRAAHTSCLKNILSCRRKQGYPFLNSSLAAIVTTHLYIFLFLHLLGFEVISTPAVETAFRQVDRVFFVPPVRPFLVDLVI